MSKRRPDVANQLTFDFSVREEVKAAETAEKRPRALLPNGLRYPREYCLKALTDWSLFPQLLTIQEAAWLTQVPVKTLYKWHSEGKLKKVGKTIGKQLRFDREALMRMWMNDNPKTAK